MDDSWINPPDGVRIPRKIAIEGNIGAGKTTLAKKLASITGFKLLEEPVVDNELLWLFYKDPRKYGFVFQVHMLTVRCAMERAGTWMICADEVSGVIYDRTLAGDTCFAEVNTEIGNISSAEYKAYLNLYEIMKYQSPYPDLLIFLNVPADELMKRIKKRGREMEEGITHHYLHKIAEAYERFIEAMRPHTAVLVWDGREATWEYLVEAYNKEFHRTEKVILKH